MMTRPENRTKKGALGALGVGTLVEVALIERMRQLTGLPDGEGILTPGGASSWRFLQFGTGLFHK
jgi:hypothetical protein